MNTSVGMPGSAAKPSMPTEAITQALGSAVNWLAISLPMLLPAGCPSGDTRVMIMPAVREISSAGICAMRPSPMVSTEYRCIDSAAPMSCCIMPTEKPPIRLITTITRPAMASPLTNFIAPSIAPNSWLSLFSSSRRRRASLTSMRLARRSLSMDICLPGNASRVKRAATSATRSEPLVMTRKLTTVRIRKITRPTARLPPTTKLPNASTICPASPWSRINRVVATESARRNKVVSSSTAGNEEKASGRGRYNDSTISRQEMQMLMAISTSTTEVGNGRISMNTMPSTTNAPATSMRRSAAPAARFNRAIMRTHL